MVQMRAIKNQSIESPAIWFRGAEYKILYVNCMAYHNKNISNVTSNVTYLNCLMGRF